MSACLFGVFGQMRGVRAFEVGYMSQTIRECFPLDLDLV